MNYLVVDLEGVFWGPAMGGAPAYDVGRAVVRQIRDLAKQFDRVICATGGHEEGRMPCTGASFRTAFWPLYKANRKDRTEAMWTALAGLIEECRAEGWLVVEAPERETPEADGREVFYEADDVIATIAAHLSSGCSVVIRSDDSDLCQCVTEAGHVDMIRRTKTGELVRLGDSGVEAWLGVPPRQVVELKALAGDGDGYKPIPGVAEGNAKKMLAAVPEHTATAVRAYVEELAKTTPSEKLSKLHLAVLEHFTPETIERAYIAARVCTDVPIDLASLVAEPVRVGVPSIGAGMIPEAEFEPAGEPLQPSTGLAVHDASVRMLASPQEAYMRMVEFQAFVQRCLVKGSDYEKYHWTPKPILLKPGAEKLAEIYGFAATFEIESALERWDANPLFFYRVRARLLRKSDRMLVAECVGSCNSWESKYRDRWAFENDIPPGVDRANLERKEFDGRKGTFFKYKVPNPDPFDVVNTVLKMAEKRAFTGAVILATRSGGIFGQDIDTLPQEAFGERSDARQWET